MGTCNDPYARILRAAGAAIEVIAVATSARIMSSMKLRASTAAPARARGSGASQPP